LAVFRALRFPALFQSNPSDEVRSLHGGCRMAVHDFGFVVGEVT
jgi:hypothetical protein